MGGGSGGSGSGGRSGDGGSTNGDAGQPGEVVRQYESQIAALKSEQAKTEAALDAARGGGTREQRKMLRELSRTLDQKIRETEYRRDTAKAEANYQKWLAGGKKGLEPARTGIKRLW